MPANTLGADAADLGLKETLGDAGAPGGALGTRISEGALHQQLGHQDSAVQRIVTSAAGAPAQTVGTGRRNPVYRPKLQ